MIRHQQKERGYYHVTVLNFCRLPWCSASRVFVSDMQLSYLFKMAAVRHLGFVMPMLGPPTKGIWWYSIVCSFVRYCGQGSSLYSGPLRWDLYVGPMRQPRERRGIGRCVRCMCELCRVEKGWVGVSSLSGIFKGTPSRRGLLSG